MPVDPCLVNAYWEIDATNLKRIYRRLRVFKVLQPVLRFHDPAGDSFDADIDIHAGSRYIDLPGPGRSYFAVLGIKTENLLFFSVARSNIVEMPHAEPLPRGSHAVFISRKKTMRRISRQKLSALNFYSSTDEDLAAVNEKSLLPGISSLPDSTE